MATRTTNVTQAQNALNVTQGKSWCTGRRKMS